MEAYHEDASKCIKQGLDVNDVLLNKLLWGHFYWSWHPDFSVKIGTFYYISYLSGDWIFLVFDRNLLKLA